MVEIEHEEVTNKYFRIYNVRNGSSWICWGWLLFFWRIQKPIFYYILVKSYIGSVDYAFYQKKSEDAILSKLIIKSLFIVIIIYSFVFLVIGPPSVYNICVLGLLYPVVASSFLVNYIILNFIASSCRMISVLFSFSRFTLTSLSIVSSSLRSCKFVN